MSENIRKAIHSLYEKNVLSEFKYSNEHKFRELSDGLNDLLDKIEFGEGTVLNCLCPITSSTSYDSILDKPIDYEAIDKTAKEMGHIRGAKTIISNAFRVLKVHTYKDLIEYRQTYLQKSVGPHFRETYKKDFGKILSRSRNIGKTSINVFTTHLNDIGLINYFQDKK